MVAGSMLQYLGHAVKVAANGLEAIAAFEAGPFDLIFMDIQMPEMNGYEATARIKEASVTAPVHVPIVAMTAHAMSGDRERCLAAGMDDYISKPISMERLAQVIARNSKNEPVISATEETPAIVPAQASSQPQEGPSSIPANLPLLLKRFGGNARLL